MTYEATKILPVTESRVAPVVRVPDRGPARRRVRAFLFGTTDERIDLARVQGEVLRQPYLR